LKFKRIWIFILIIILAFGSWGCTQKENSNKDKQIIIYVDIKDTRSVNVLKSLIDGYKDKNSGVSVNIVSSLGGKAEEDLNKGSSSDIILTSRNNMINLTSKGYLSVMKNYYEENKIDERYYSIVNSYGRYNDKSYGMPMLVSSLEILYNLDAIKKMNLSEPKDINGLNNLMLNLNKNSTRIPVVINENKDINSELFSLIVNNTVDINKLDNNYDSGFEAYRNISGMKKSFDILKNMVTTGVLGMHTFEMGNESTISKFSKGDIPLIVVTSGYVNELKKGNIKLFENYSSFEAYRGIIPIISDVMICVSVSSKNGEEVNKFIKYIFSDDTQKKLVESGFVSGNKDINKANEGIGAAFASHLSKANENSIIYTDTIPNKLREAIESRLDLILSGKFSNNEWEELLKNIY